MKKISILIMLITTLSLSGCTSKVETPKEEGKINSVYCNDCANESKEVTKFCSNCGVEAKWVADKPEDTKNKEKEEISKEDTETNNNNTAANNSVQSRKNEYLQKLRLVKQNLSDLDYLYENGVTSELVEAEGTRFGRWDNMLNEIYGVLKDQLSTSEMEKLKKEQYNWVVYRDKTADETSLEEGGGGSMTGIIYNSQLADLTEERCNVLVNNYMK